MFFQGLQCLDYGRFTHINISNCFFFFFWYPGDFLTPAQVITIKLEISKRYGLYKVREDHLGKGKPVKSQAYQF